MFKLLNLLKRDRIWDFAGGIHPPEMKLQSSQSPSRTVPLSALYIVPLVQHAGSAAELCVTIGDHVLKGQPLTEGDDRALPVHAPTSGVIRDISPQVTAHPSGLAEMSVIIEADGKDNSVEATPMLDYKQHDPFALLQHLHKAGIAGLGGAGFPTASKLKGGLQQVETLIINGAECEPYITADDRLMQERALEMLQGIEILDYLLKPKTIFLAVEDNKPEAIAAIKAEISAFPQVQLRVIPTKYPSGGAKQLTKILTGKEVPQGKRSSSIGVLMQNVGTVFAIKRAVIDGEPLIERLVTLTGNAITQPGNLWARLGTPVADLLAFAGFAPQEKQKIIMGGPLMGFTLPNLNVPVVKICNCLLAPTDDEIAPAEDELACIRCSACMDACPAGLLPQQLYWFSKGEDHEKARQHNIFDCIECGACAYVCPSHIPLVQYYRKEKALIWALDEENKRANAAKIRFEAKQARMAREKEAREQRHKTAAVKVDDNDKEAISAALARVKSTGSKPIIISMKGELPDNSEMIAARAARKEQARLRRAEQQKQTAVVTVADNEADPRKAALAAAIARAKAKKQQNSTGDNVTQEATKIADNAEQDPRKAALAAAIGRAKAKKAQAQAEQSLKEEQTQAEAPAVDPRKAAIAAAVARAKAKKTQSAAVESDSSASAPVAEDPKKAAIAAAIARAKAKKQQQAVNQETKPEAAAKEGENPRKAAIAAAIARAKAKKQQIQSDD